MTKLYSHKTLLIVLPILSLVFLTFTPLQTAGAWDDPLRPETLQKALSEAHNLFKNNNEGKNADYIPYLAKVDPRLFGLTLVLVDGTTYEAGDSRFPFAIESISKIFTLCRVLQDQGAEAVRDKIGVDATGLPFNSVMAVELNKARSVNPFVNAGAMAAVSMVEGRDSDDRWKNIIETMNLFAGRELKVNEDVYRSESETNTHNMAIAVLLKSYGRFYGDPVEVLDLYTRQCSVSITARDLAVMGATLANGGINPITGLRALDERHVPKVLAVMSVNGLYENTGEWLYDTGLPAKSGVGGGVLAVVPGECAIAAFSPPLDEYGSSVRGRKAIKFLSERLGANIFLGR